LSILRKYQQEAIDTTLSKLEKGINRSIIVLPTGAGKTKTAVSLVKQAGFKSVLFCSDSEELIEQSAMAFIREAFDERLSNHIQEQGFLNYVKDGGIFAGSPYKIGAIKASLFQPYGNIVACSLQTLYRRLDLLKPDQFDCVIIDECHGATAKTWVQSINYLKPKLLLGLTATPVRTDGVSLGTVFDEIVYEYKLKDAIEQGYLCEIDAIRVKTNISLDSVKTTAGDLNQKELSEEINCYARNKLIVDSYLKYAKGRKGIFFCVTIQHCLDLLEVFLEAGIKAKAVSSNEELTGDRSLTIKQYKDNEFDVLINVSIVCKGFDDPETSCVGNACPTKSYTKWAQGIGRGLRLKQGEFKDCVILDFVDNTSKHSLVNSFSLDKGLPPEERVYITSKDREKLIEARRVRIEGKTNKDERVQLLPIMTPKFKTTIKSTELADDQQKAHLKFLGFDTDETVYTRENYREIIGSFPADSEQIFELKKFGFKMDSPITRSQASYSLYMYKNDKIKQKR